MHRADNARLVAFCSRTLQRAREYASRFDAQWAFESLETLARCDDVDAAYIATPNALHAEQTALLLEHGKHVLVEKPMATTAADAQRMLETAQRCRRQLSVMLPMRYHPANERALRAVEDGTLGKLLLVRAHIGIWHHERADWKHDPALAGGGAAIDLGPHALDLLQWFAGPVEEVRAVVQNVYALGPVEDWAAAILRFASGARGLADVGYCFHGYGGRIELHGSEATMILDGTLQQIGRYRMWQRRGNTANPVTIEEGVFDRCYVAAIEEFGDAVRQNRLPRVTPRDGVACQEVIDAIYRSAAEDRTVTL